MTNYTFYPNIIPKSRVIWDVEGQKYSKLWSFKQKKAIFDKFWAFFGFISKLININH